MESLSSALGLLSPREPQARASPPSLTARGSEACGSPGRTRPHLSGAGLSRRTGWYLGCGVWREKHPHVALAWCRGWGAGRRYPGHLPNEDPGVDSARRLVLEQPPPCPSGRGPALQGLLGTPGLDQRAALPVPESRLSEWARAWWHTRGRAGGLGRECIYKCCLQSKFHSILTSSLFPGALVSTPPLHPQLSFPLGFCLFVTL